jgi:2-keto-4-pentenoate hydratase/2-oxohepta-3-ene-1,7-dioic acid hydratase in catechol pathway
MKFAAFKIKAEDRRTIGVFDGENYIDIVALSDGAVPDSLVAVLEQGDEGLARIRALLDGSVPEACRYAADAVELLPPIERPGKIIHTACNFDAHLDELTGWEAPEWQEHNWGEFHFEHPTGFLQAGNCVGGSGAPVSAPPFTRQLDYEIEVGIVIGRPAYQVSVEEAMDYVGGLAIFNDLSARDIQAREHANKVILLGKSFKGSCPLGPWLVTLDEIEDPDNLAMKLYLNGELRQDSGTNNMHYKMAQLVSWWSNMPLEPGDIITTGSPPGVISGMKNPQWLKPGDLLEAKVECLGTLVTPIV